MLEEPGRTFQRTFARRELQSLSTGRTFERGRSYALDGHVRRLQVTDHEVTATVDGTAAYQVRLSAQHGDAEWSCTCPVGLDDEFCKHVVALGLVATGEIVPDVTDDVTEVADEVDLAGYLTGLDHQALVDLVLERAAADGLFGARLRAAAASTSGARPDLTSYRQALAAAFDTDGYVSYREAYDYTAGITSMLHELQTLLDEGHAADVMTLSEYAAQLAQDSLGYIDDSDGGMSIVAEQISDLHRSACVDAQPDPVALARSLYRLERNGDDLEVFYGAVETYTEILGDAGLDEYRQLARSEWEHVPALGPGDDRTWSSDRFRLTRIMVSLAELSDDVDEVVNVLARDQSTAYQFVRIAQVLLQADRRDEALEWALKGLSLHGYHDYRLVEIAAEEHHRLGRASQAVELVWQAFEETPGVQTYGRLKEHAERAGTWPVRHEQALAHLRRQSSSQRDRSNLVAVLLVDGAVEDAWTEATLGGCRRDQLLELARLREDDHPDDAIPVWREEVTREINAMNNSSYANAVATIERISRLLRTAGREEEFAAYVSDLATQHRRKRNLMKLFAERGW
ncbi:SWIM zinc finger family protein [Nocardioides luteus]|uniref:SWIM-type domain-containing protein n=1 Tax=Nocardioides luteus TaxID=1844 RepID=A0A1J4N970_9ACTN|nr:DUF6880 family protein [Nocardioides luteus]OIJ28030.1 hypothetical protein UG56_004845 [Nocardioides luteus]